MKPTEDLIENPIDARMKATGITAMRVAQACGVSLPMVYQWRNGTSSPKTRRWKKLEALLGRGLKAEWDEYRVATDGGL